MSDPGVPAVLHVDSAKGWRGGQAQVFELLIGLQAMGAGPALAAPPGSALGRRAREAGIEVFDVPMRGEWDPWAPRRIAALATDRNAALLHAHDSRAHGLCWRALRRLPRTPLLVTRRVDFPVGGNWLSRRKYTAPRTHYIAISSGVRDALIAGGVAPEERIRLVPSGINPARFGPGGAREDIKAMFGFPAGTIVIGSIGALTDHKGHRYLIDAAKRILASYPEARILIVGEGELRGDLTRRIEEHGLAGEVVLAGYQEDIVSFLAGFDLFILPSHMEGLCTSLLDALYFRLPTVATRVGGVPDVVEDGRNGLLVAPRNPAALAQAAIRLLGDEGLRRRLGEEGRRTVEERFTARRMVDGAVEVYRSVAVEAPALAKPSETSAQEAVNWKRI